MKIILNVDNYFAYRLSDLCSKTREGKVDKSFLSSLIEFTCLSPEGSIYSTSGESRLFLSGICCQMTLFRGCLLICLIMKLHRGNRKILDNDRDFQPNQLLNRRMFGQFLFPACT